MAKMPMKSKGMPKEMPPKGGMHKMGNGKMMSDAEHERMYGEMHGKAKVKGKK